MKPHRSFVLAVLIGMVLVAVAVSLAQTPSQQTNQKKQTESCCATDSCAMKTGEKTDAAAGGCCCGDSCDMEKKHDANHASKGSCCCGDSHKTTAQNDSKNASTKHQCCGAEMANNMTAKHDMKSMKHMKNHDMKNHDMKNGCCCCGDSCDMDMKKTAN